MAIKKKIIAEHIVQIREDIPGTCIHKRAERIIRCYDCQYFMVPQSEYDDTWCKRSYISTIPEGFCYWAKQRAVLKEFQYQGKTIPTER